MKEHPAKAVAFWARKELLRREPGRCCRCGKPNANGKRQCDACRAYAAEYRERKRAQKHGVMVDDRTLAGLVRRIGSVEHALARLQVAAAACYKRGYCAGRRERRKADERASYFNALTAHSYAEAVG